MIMDEYFIVSLLKKYLGGIKSGFKSIVLDNRNTEGKTRNYLLFTLNDNVTQEVDITDYLQENDIQKYMEKKFTPTDDLTISTDNVWSASKINEIINQLDQDKVNKTDLANGRRYIGNIATVSALPTTGNENGDYYYVLADMHYYQWNAANTWDDIGVGEGGYNELNNKIESNKSKLYKSLLKKTVTGSGMVTVKDSADWEVLDLKLSGKSVQNGTPTPDVPVPIQSVGTLNSTTGKYDVDVVACGKNLVNYSHLTTMSAAGITYTNNNDGSFSVKGTSNNVSPSRHSSLKLPKGSYVMSTNSNASSPAVSLYVRVIKNGVTAYHSDAFVIDGTETVVTWYLQVSVANLTVDEIVRPQIEWGQVATTYEPYKGNKITLSLDSPLRGIGSVADKIIKKDGVWGVERNIGNALFDGSSDESWAVNSVWSAGNYLAVYYKVSDRLRISNGLSNIALVRTSVANLVANEIAVAEGSYLSLGTDLVFYLFIAKSRLASADAAGLKTWLQSNLVTLVYQLATPTFTSLPEAQQTLLNNLPMYNALTNLYVTDTLNPTIELQYAQDANIVINNLTNAIISLGGNI